MNGNKRVTIQTKCYIESRKKVLAGRQGLRWPEILTADVGAMSIGDKKIKAYVGLKDLLGWKSGTPM